LIERGQLQLLLGAKAADQPALAHAEPIGQPADAESLEADDRRELHGGGKRLSSRACDLRGGSAWWLGWAGVEIEAHGERMVVDPLQDARAVFAWLGERAEAITIPEVVAARPGAIAGLLTHLHRDHADAAALSTVLGAGATVYQPVDYGGEGRERLAVAQADHELTAAALARQPAAA
jgi:hypothetical protein